MSTLKTITSLNALVQNEAKLSRRPMQNGADRRARIADQAADDGADKRLQPDDETGVVIERGHRPDQNAGYGAEQRSKQKRQRARASRPDADDTRAYAIDRRRAQCLARRACVRRTENSSRLNTTADATISSVCEVTITLPKRNTSLVSGLVRNPSGPKNNRPKPESAEGQRDRDDQQKQNRSVGKRPQRDALDQRRDRNDQRNGKRDLRPGGQARRRQ